MSKISFILSLCLFLSCVSVNITRTKAYEINKKYLLEKYNQKIDDKNIGFYIQKGKWIFFNQVENGEIEVIIDRNGKILK